MVVNMRLNEISTSKLADYKSAAGKDASAADKAGNTARANKRFSGIVKATNKQFDNDAKKSVKESDADDNPFADEIYNELENRYPNLIAKAGHRAVGNAITDFVQYEGQYDASELVSDVARAIRSSLASAEF
jgi:hypothetical protein